jgi:hypothetical protein
MSHSEVHPGLNVKRSLLDAVLAGLIALIVFGPIVGIVLNGYSFNFRAAPSGVDYRDGDGWAAVTEPVSANHTWP